MRESFKSGRTVFYMQHAELDAFDDLRVPGARGAKVREWRVMAEYAGRVSVHLAFMSEAEADASMDRIKASADAGTPS